MCPNHPGTPLAAARRVSLALVLASVTIAAGCAGHRLARADGALQHGRATASPSSAYLGELELSSARLPAGLSAYDAIVRLRPQFIDRGTPPAVFVNGMPLHDLGALTGILAEEVLDVRFVRGSEAEELLGPRAVGRARVLVIRLKPGGGI